MPWANFDDAFTEHPKIDALTDAAFRLHVAGICYSNRHLTDGYIDANRIARLVPRYKRSALQELMHGGLWLPADGGYRIHDYLDWNRSKQQIEQERERIRRVRSEAGKAGARARWGA